MTTRQAGGTLSLAPADAAALATSPAVNLSAVVGVVTDPDGHATTFTDDNLGRATAVAGLLGATWQTPRDALGNVSAVTDPLNHVTANQYGTGSGAGDLTLVTHPDSSTQQYAYDPTFHKPTTLTDADGHTTTLTYDATTGDLLTRQDALLKVTTYSYYLTGGVSDGLVQSATDPDGGALTSPTPLACSAASPSRAAAPPIPHSGSDLARPRTSPYSVLYPAGGPSAQGRSARGRRRPY